MISLTQLLLEVDIARNRYSWLRPDGRFIPIKSSHGDDAFRYTKDTNDPIMSLWKRGYMRIVFYGNTLIVHNEVMPPNEKQKQALIDLAIETSDVAIEYDSGEDQKIIWSVHDVMENQKTS